MKPWGPFWLQESLKKSSRIDNFWGSSRGRNSRFFEAREELSALLRVKNLNLLPAKFRFDMDTWPGEEKGAHRVITTIADLYPFRLIFGEALFGNLIFFVGFFGFMLLCLGGRCSQKRLSTYSEHAPRGLG